ncbi:hypothetical protein DFJ73DRAFT_812657 [Zopfochytrium polystomum]|nr:hypothetical protein DFJ73DRAFT_812657 [Zopfochytrium polystomum]
MNSPTSPTSTDSFESPTSSQQSLLRRRRANGNSFRALTYKAISYQKRQVFTNVCCISLCPFLMVIISALFGNAVTGLIRQSMKFEYIQYCSNNNSLASDGFPAFNDTSEVVYGRNIPNGKSVNFIRNEQATDPGGNAGALGYTFDKPCVFWFGADFPKNSPIYERNANAPQFARLDSTYVPAPDGGWINFLKDYVNTRPPYVGNKTNHVNLFVQVQQSSWVYTTARTPELQALLGTQPSYPAAGTNATLFLLQLEKSDLSSYFNPPYLPPGAQSTAGGTGLLAAIPQRLALRFSPSSIDGVAFVPTFTAIPTLSPDDLDDALRIRIDLVIRALANLDKSVLLRAGASNEAFLDFYVRATAAASIMPYGAVFLDSWDPKRLSLRAILQFGNDKRLTLAGCFPTAGQRLVTQMVQLNQASVKAFGAAVGGRLNLATITPGIRAFPATMTKGFGFQVSGLIGGVLYPFGVSFLLPIFVIVLVKEKEDRIFVMMTMNGMKSWAFYISHYVTFFVLYAISACIFLIAGNIVRLTMFTETDTSLLLLLLFMWGHAQVVLAFFFASLFSRSRIALVLTFLVVLCGVIVSLVTETLFPTGSEMPVTFFLWPPFAFYRALGRFNTASYSLVEKPYTLKAVKANTEIATILGFLALDIFLYGLLSLYLAAVLPTEFGSPRPWYFPISFVRDYFAKSGSKRRIMHRGNSESNVLNHIGKTGEDSDVVVERERVDAHSYPWDCPLVISHLSKTYPSRAGLAPKAAVRDVSIAVERGIVFGLLGPNGAGKTTLISILTGLYPASRGSARLAGFDIHTHLDDVYRVIGICPQFDILWDSLTVAEHLFFYARLKGIPVNEERTAVAVSLDQVQLSRIQHRQAKHLSGGEKRRLSIAIALVGDPAVVFLDEPTTGLDPEVRRMIWGIIQGARVGRTIVLTTHSMEEAESVCTRIGIMAKGTLRCLGNPLRLKERYGAGFRLFFNVARRDDTATACQWIESALPSGWRKVDAFATSTSYEFPAAAGTISLLFETVEREKRLRGIMDWGISQTTLEEVFLRIISDADADGD